MVFGSGNKFRIRRSQSKASYLASRRDKDRIVADSDTGSYKRTMSPNGRVIPPESVSDTQKVNPRETVWPLNRQNKDMVKSNNNVNLIRRSSIKDKQKTSPIQDKCDDREDLKKPNIVLPDVLPVNAKLFNSRSQSLTRPTHLSLTPLDSSHHKIIKPPLKSPPHSPPRTPPKSPSRGSPFAPLKATNLSNTPVIPVASSATNYSPRPQQIMTSSSPIKTFVNSSTSISPPSPKRASPQRASPQRASPQIKPSLTTSLKLSSRLSVSSTNTSSSGSSPLHTSPLSTPPGSPKSSQSPDVSPPDSPKTEECPKVIEGLQMIQRTEVVLRVNTSTIDASSQTDKEELPPTPLPTRKKLQEEIECEKLSEDFINHLPTSDRLKDLLVPGPDHKKPTDYVSGLFRVDVTLRPRPLLSPFRSRNNTPSSSPPPTSTTTTTSITAKINAPTSPVTPTIEPTSPLSGTSTYFTTSEPKAKFLTRFSQDMNQCHIVKDTKDLSQKKEELVSRLDRKLEVLRSEQLVVSEECKINEELGENVEAHINRLARPHEVAKFRLHIEEVGKITSLLLGLSGRLARAENALMGMPDDHPERRILESKRDKLLDQLEEAKKLKECIDKRSISVSTILYKYLNSEEYADYDHYINMKAKLIMDSKEIADKIKLGEEQLLALRETLIVTD